MARGWHCPPDCMGVELYGMKCPDDLGSDEVCPNGIPDDEEYMASEDPRFFLGEELVKAVTKILDQDEEEQPMVDFHAKLRAKRSTSTGAVIKPLPHTFVALDFETTGFDRANDRIIEIGAVRFTEGEPVAIFNTLVNPEISVSAKVTEMTGHTDEDLLKGISEEHAIITLVHFIASSPIVGHNVLFDYEFYYRAAKHIEIGVCNKLIDTLTIARERHKYPHKLPDMCKKYNVTQEGWHSAYFDALACGNLLLAMHAEDKNYGEGKQVADYIDVIGWKRQYEEPTWKPSWITLKGQGDIHVQEGPRKARQIVIPKRDNPEYKWFGKGCKYQQCQFEECDAEGVGLGYPVLIFCSHTDAPQDELPHESNCSSNMCLRGGLCDDIPF